jgi:hypothetical protein
MQRDVYEYWKSSHSDYERGIKLFYSPVKNRPKLLIVGFQPGGDASNFQYLREQFEAGDFAPPEQHEYLNMDYDLAKVMRNDLFYDAHDILEDSVALNAIFFRAPGASTWRSELPDDRRERMEEFCFEKLDEIIQKIQPQNILFFGLATWERMQERYGFETAETQYRLSRSNYRLLSISESDSPQYFGMCHPSSGNTRLSDEEKAKASEVLLSRLE